MKFAKLDLLILLVCAGGIVSYWALGSTFDASIPTALSPAPSLAASTEVATRPSSISSAHVNAPEARLPNGEKPDSKPQSDTAYPNQTEASSQPVSFDAANAAARSALVNIVCEQREGSLRPISGSGVIIDPRGIILTNAHVAQYVLLAESPHINLSCYVRTGAPAKSEWVASVLYIPPVWVNAHASEINAQHALGTGEHDYALLYITGAAPGGSLPASFPYVTPDTSNSTATGQQVLAASYPAEFAGGIATAYGLYPASSVASIKKLLTFATSTVDEISLGGIIEAQNGSSGGAVLDAGGRLIALIATTSGGSTTADRDLHAVTLDYINRDLALQTGKTLPQLLAEDPAQATTAFTSSTAVHLLKVFLPYLSY